jgi:hypothetical protein
MNDQVALAADCSLALEAILLRYLQTDHSFPWPGGDGLTMQEAVASYQDALALGRVPGRSELERRHPELTDELERFFEPTRARPPRPRRGLVRTTKFTKPGRSIPDQE